MDAAPAHLGRLGARARPTGSAAASDARTYCADVLRAAGFAISEQSFEYSAFPASVGPPIAGIAAALAAIAIYLGRRAPMLTGAALATLAACLIGLGYLGRSGVLHFPLMRRRGVNLQAVRQDPDSGADPSVWLVAHLDSKWQPVSMIARLLGVGGTTVGIIALIILTLIPWQGARGGGSATTEIASAVVLMLTWLATMPLTLSVITDRNDGAGALDNASGVAAVLEAAQSLPRAARVGVVITDAEELALAGARAWLRSRSPGVALNCDTVDDNGPLAVMYTGRAPNRLISAVVESATAAGEPVRTLRLLPGILTDSVALADAGWEALTLSRGTLRTLRRIHTSHDTLAAMRGTGIAGAARVLARAVTELT